MLLVLTACNSSSAPVSSSTDSVQASTPAVVVPEQFVGTFKGTETGTFNGAPYSNTITLILTKSGNDYVGTWTTGSGNTGTIAGVISGSDSTATITETDSCFGALPTILTATANGITGTAVGSLTCGNISTVFDLVVQ